MRSATYLSLSLLLLVSSLAGGSTDKKGSFSSGGTSVSGDASAFSSTGGATSSSVRTRTHVSPKGKPKTTTTTSTSTSTGGTTTSKEHPKKKRRGGKGKKSTTEGVELGEGTSVSYSSASGTGGVFASSSSSSSPGGSKGTASTSVGGTTRTVTKERGRGKGDTSSSTKDVGGSKGTASSPYQRYPTCRGIAQFKCCDDRVFHKIDGKVYCGCWGDEPTKDYCSFLRLNSEPLVVQDIFGALSGDICVCADDRVTTNEIIDGCRGTVKRECCDQYGGSKNCRCNGDKCEYTRISNKPLMWKSRTTNRACVCY